MDPEVFEAILAAEKQYFAKNSDVSPTLLDTEKQHETLDPDVLAAILAAEKQFAAKNSDVSPTLLDTEKQHERLDPDVLAVLLAAEKQLDAKNSDGSVAPLDTQKQHESKKRLASEFQPNVKPKTKRQRRFLKPTILFVGSGNLSFEIEFAKKYPKIARHLIVTTFEPESAAIVPNKRALEELGAKVLHKVDATKLHTYSFIKYHKIARIYFVLPYVTQFTTSKMLQGFFKSMVQAELYDTDVHVVRVRGGKYELKKPRYKRLFHHTKDGYDMIKHYEKLYGFNNIDFYGFSLYTKHRLDFADFPGYRHTKTNQQSSSAPIISGKNSLDYVFCFNYGLQSGYDSEEIDSDDEFDAGLVEPKI